jgi:hypothetical protein
MSIVGVGLLGVGVALGAHVAAKRAARRAEKTYRALLGPQHADAPDDPLWGEMRRKVGRWGCLAVALELLRGLGVLIALGAAVLWAAG